MKNITKEQIEALIDKYLILQNVKKGNWNTDQLMLCHPDHGCSGNELIAEGTSLVYKKEWFKTILFSLIEEAIAIHSNIDSFQLDFPIRDESEILKQLLEVKIHKTSMVENNSVNVNYPEDDKIFKEL